MTYDTLVAQIKAYANRSDTYFVEQIPNFINQGVNKIYMEAKNIGFQKTLNFTNRLTIGTPFLAKPKDWKETISLIVRAANGDYTLFPRSYEFCKIYNSGNITGLPKFYADYDLISQEAGLSNFYLSPIPNGITQDQGYFYQLVYLSLPLFDAVHQTNFLTDRYPALLLYACMSEAMPFLKTDERIPVFSSMYDRALQSVNKETVQRYTDRTSKRNKD